MHMQTNAKRSMKPESIRTIYDTVICLGYKVTDHITPDPGFK